MWAAMLPCLVGASPALRLCCVALLVVLTGYAALRARRTGDGLAMLVDATAMAVLAVAAELAHGMPAAEQVAEGVARSAAHTVAHGGVSIATVLAVAAAVGWAALRLSSARPAQARAVLLPTAGTIAATAMVGLMAASVIVAPH